MFGRRRRALENLGEDLREHIERETQENVERGMTREAARAAALRKFGNVTRVMEDTRAVWTWTWLEQLVQDIRYGVRGLRRNPGFTAVVVLTLALGIGMNTAVFSLVNAILVRPLAYPDPERLVWVANYNPLFKNEIVSEPDYIDWKSQAQSFESMTAYGFSDEAIVTADGAEQHRVAEVTSDFWRLSGARPALGRLLTPSDRDEVVLTHALFERQFHSDPHVVGRRVTVGGQPATIIGVLPADFRFLLPAPGGPFGAPLGAGREMEAFAPNAAEWDLPDRHRNGSIQTVVARLRPGVSVARARSELEGIQARIARDNPYISYRGKQIRVTPLKERLVADARPALLVLLAAVGFVLLIACANIANLLVARGAVRQKEIAIRTAIGAGKARVIRQFLGENLALALAGGAAGLLLARAALPVIVRLAPASLPRLGETAMDSRVLLFALAATLVTGLVFGASPAIFLRRSNTYDVLKQGGRSSAASSTSLAARRLLVATELALALVLLTGAGLMLKSFWRMSERPPEFAPDHIVELKISLSGPNYPDVAARQRFAQEMLDRLEHFPGVQHAGLIEPFARGILRLPHVGFLTSPNTPGANYYAVSSGLGRALGMRLLQGRWMTDHEKEPVLMVNERLAQVVFGQTDVIGKQLSQPLDQSGAPATIVGVVSDLKFSRLDAVPDPEVFIPYQAPPFLMTMTVMVHTAPEASAAAPSIRSLVGGIDRTQPVYEVKTLEQALAESIAPRRFNLVLLGVFAASALLLALIGIYGVIAYAVAQRTHEIGVRMALGAQRGGVVRLVVREGMSLAAVGIAAGLAAAFGLTRLMASLLYDVKPSDPSTYAAVAVALGATALVACWKPALRAAWVDPARALREE